MRVLEVVEEVASPGQQRAALLLSLLILSVLFALLPHADLPLRPLPNIGGVYGAATAMIDLATFWLLVSAPSQPRSHSAIAGAYLFSGLMAVMHVLTFPGAVLPGQPVFGSPQAVSWLFIAWRAGFSLFITWAALQDRAGAADDRGPSRWPVLAAVAAAAVSVASSQMTDAAATNNAGGRQFFGAFTIYGSYLAAAIAATAVFVIWRRGLHRRALFVWLIVVLTAEAAGVWLSTFSGARYTLAWYAVRAEGVLANSVVLFLLAQHFRTVQRRLANTVVMLQRRTEELQTAVMQKERAESSLAQAEKLKMVGQLGAGLAHDLNNILQVVTGRLSILRRRVGEAADADVLSIRQSLKKAEGLTRQLTLLSARRTIAAQGLQPAPVIDRIVDSARSLVEPTHRLTLSTADDLPCVAVDALELEVTLNNLVTNARDAMPGGGAIDVRLAAVTDAAMGPALAIEVIDGGCGMPAEVQARIFEPFFTTKPQGKGTGLGLAQVAAFAHAAGGRIDLHSVVGKGTRLALLLPARRPATGVTQPRGVGALLSHGQVILLVDDNEEVREASRQMLDASGFVVKAVSSGQEALDALAAGFAPHILVSDIVMPNGMDGVQLVRRVRQSHPQVRSVLVTGHSDIADKAASEGFPIVSKPYEMATLMQALG